MNSVSDQYLSRLLSTIRQNKNIKNIKDINENEVYIEFYDGVTRWVGWRDVLELINNSK